jgi:hypothetical protein
MDNKKCRKCGDAKSLENFYELQQIGAKGQVWKYFDAWCKGCRNKNSYNRKKITKEKAVQYKGGKCEDCGIIDIPDVFDFHHLDETKKDFSIAKTSKKFDTIKEELDKCVLLCANCHRKRHAMAFKQ